MSRQTANDFYQKVYETTAQIPKGKVATYGQIAEMCGKPGGARMVGWAMHSVPEHLSLPCHRVVNASGRLAPDSVFGGYRIQRSILEAEGITFKNNGSIDLSRHLW